MTLSEIIFRFAEGFKKRKLSRNPSATLTDCKILPIHWEEVLNEIKELNFGTNNVPQPMVFGVIWPHWNESEIGWNKFLNGEETSATSTFKVKYRKSADISNDIRYSWELNRLTWLIPAAVYGREESKTECIEFMRNFLKYDLPGYGLRWNSMIELAMQSLSIQILASALGGQLGESDRESISGALSNRLYWLNNLPSRYSSGNNHRIAELVAQISILESMSESESSLSRQGELIKQLELQTSLDGLNAERASDYHLFVLDLLISLQLLWPNLARKDELGIISTKMCIATHKMRMSFQVWPSFGDSDEASLIGTLVAREDRAQFLESFCKNHFGAIGSGIVTFPDSGFTIVKKKMGKSDLSVLIDHGPIGFGRISAHGHADTMAIWLTLDELPLLVEAGTFSYHSNSDVRNLLRSGWLHNTITLNGESLSKPSGPFLWIPKHSAIGFLKTAHESTEFIEIAIGMKYPRSKQRKAGIATRIIKIGEEGVEIIDIARRVHSIESHFILAPYLGLHRDQPLNGYKFIAPTGQCLTISTNIGSKIVLSNVEISRAYGVLEPAYRVSIVGTEKNQIFLSVTKMELE